MDETPESFAYRCLPMNIANQHGWEILSPCGFEAEWDGGTGAEAVRIVADAGGQNGPVSLFGQGTITFHVPGLFRTPPGWNLYVGGPPNEGRDGIAPLSGVIETDWSPYSFTMNWRFTRPHHIIRFEENEPFCFFFPVDRRVLEQVEPAFLDIDAHPTLRSNYEAWSRSRDAFHAQVAAEQPGRPSDKWQKLYYRGLDVAGRPGVADHQAKLQLREFGNPPEPPLARSCPVAHGLPPAGRDDAPGQRREWIARTRQRLLGLSRASLAIPEVAGISSVQFLQHHYAAHWPLILRGVAKQWPAVRTWTPDYLRAVMGRRPVEVQGDRAEAGDYERNKDRHRRTMAFDAFMDAIGTDGAGNDLYMTAYNHGGNAEALAPLVGDIGEVPGVVAQASIRKNGLMWIGPAGTFTPLHHDLTNNLFVQMMGEKSILLVSPDESAKLYNRHHVYSDVFDLDDAARLRDFPLAVDVRSYRVTLEPGDAVFIPVGWWHQVRALTFSASVTSTAFPWPNDFYEDYPG